MSAPDRAAAHVQGRAHDAVSLEPFETKNAADDIHNRIECPDLVQVYPFERHLVDGRFGLGELIEQQTRAMFSGFRETGSSDQLLNLRESAMIVVGLPSFMVVGFVHLAMVVLRLTVTVGCVGV
jgi:hypothetical protein